MLNQGSNKLIQRTIYIILKELTEYNTEYMESTLTKCPTICSIPTAVHKGMFCLDESNLKIHLCEYHSYSGRVSPLHTQ